MMKYGVAIGLFTAASAVHAAGLCRPSEVTVFNCDLKENKKIVSMCASKDLSSTRGFLQYRYGNNRKIELKFPGDLKNSRDQIGYDEYSRPDLSAFIVGFDNGGYRYEISETTEGGDENGTTTRSLLVSAKSGGRSLKLTCLENENTVSSISTLDQVLKCDKEHAIVEGACN
jgi:predicted transcriptional regulator